jgi:hypothetical protein
MLHLGERARQFVEGPRPELTGVHGSNAQSKPALTSNDLSQQLAYMHHPAGKIIESHVHSPLPRQVQHTQETLLVRRGKLRVDFYDEQHNYLESRILEAGDVVLLVAGGHGFEVLEDLEMFEVKQGPYAEDKIRFAPKEPVQPKFHRA